MSAPVAVPPWLRLLSRLCLRCYPAVFRRESGEEYLDGVVHRWLRERTRASAVVAVVRTVWLLMTDTIRAAPGAWRAAGALQRARVQAGSGGWFPGWLEGGLADGRIALRSLARRPGFAAFVVVTLGTGIGANAALFGALDRVVLRPLPFPDGDRMVYLAMREPELGWQLAPPEEAVTRWRSGSQALEWLEAYKPSTVTRTGDGRAELLPVTMVSAGLPVALGVRAVVGHMPGVLDLEPGDPAQILLSEGLWRREFGGHPSAIGRTMILNDTVFTIVGVWPGAAAFELGRSPALWRVTSGSVLSEDGFGYVLALVRRGATISSVEAELAGLASGLESVPDGFVPAVNPPYGFLGEAYVQGIWLVFGGVLALMLASLVNAANLLLNRTISRRGELGVRAAIGASRSAVLRLFLIESLVLTVLGLGVAAAVAHWGGELLGALVPERLSVLKESTMDRRVLGFAAALAGVCAVVGVVVPMTQLRRRDVGSLLSRAGGRSPARSGWGKDVLVASQVALAVVLVTGATLTIRSFRQLLSVDTGIAVDEVAQFALRLPAARYPTGEARSVFWQRLVESVTGLPGVRAMANSGSRLLRFSTTMSVPHLAGASPPRAPGEFSYTNGIGPGYFDATGIAILEGRDFDRSDVERVVIVNRSFARALGGRVLGRSLTFDDSVFYRIIGVAEDVSAGGVAEDAVRAQMYVRSSDLTSDYERFIVRTSGSPSALLEAIRGRAAELDPDLPFRELTTAREIVRESTARHRFVAQLLAVFSGLSLLLAVTGVYGVVSLNVNRHMREAGIRVALGASTAHVVRAVLVTGMRPVIAGVAIGTIIALLAVRPLDSLLYRISTTDPISIASGAGVLLWLAMLACAIPALRASRSDPVRALRSE